MTAGSPREPGFVVIAHWRIRPGEEARVLALLDELEVATREEAGCVSFDSSVGRADPGAVTLVERYLDRASFRAHRASEHFRALVLERAVPLLAARDVHAHIPVPLDP